MSSTRRPLVAVILVGLVFLFAAPALATEEPTDTTGTTVAVTEDSVAEQEELEATTGQQPVLTVPPPETTEGPADWTYRYLVPTLIALAVIVVIMTTVQYFTRVVRKRYKIVE